MSLMPFEVQGSMVRGSKFHFPLLKTREPTYAANNKQIARALGLRTSRRQLADIGEWRKRSDFPKKQRRGYVIAELREWVSGARGQVSGEEPDAHTAHDTSSPDTSHLAPRTVTSLRTPAEIQAAREQAVIDYYIKGKPYEKFSAEDREVLTKHGIESRVESRESRAEIRNGTTLDPRPSTLDQLEPIQNVTTQAELSVMLARYWHGRFKGDLSEQLISDWKLGKRLRKGVPLPPAKERAYHIGGKWVEWMEQHILTDPRYRLGADNQGELDIHDRAYLATSETKILEKEIKRFEFERTQARYVTADLARNTRRGMLKLALNKVQRGHEHEDTKTRAEWLAAKLSPEDLQAWREFDMQLARTRIDAIHADFQKGIAADLETEQAKQLAIES